MEKTYKLRPLGSKDIFLISAIISNLGVQEIITCFSEETLKAISKLCADQFAVLAEVDNDENKDAINDSKKAVIDIVSGDIGVFGGLALNIANLVFTNLPKCEKDLYAFLSSLSGMSIKELEEMAPAMFVSMIIDVVRMEEFKDFFKAVLRLQK